MAQLGVMTTEFPATTLDDTAAAAVRHGVTTVQLQLGSVFPDVPLSESLLRGLDVLGERADEQVAREAAETLRSRGLRIAAVDGTYNMVHPNPARRETNLRHLIRLIELAPAFGTTVVTLCTGSRADIMWSGHQLNSSEAAWNDLLGPMRAAAAAAEASGVDLAFEPEFNNVVDSAQRARRLIDEVGSPRVKVLMDAANIFHTGDLLRQREHLHEAFALIGSDIALAHAKDLDHDGDAGGRAAGQGQLDYPHYLTELRDCGFEGAVVLHQIKELAPDRMGEAFDHVRRSAPPGYLD